MQRGAHQDGGMCLALQEALPFLQKWYEEQVEQHPAAGGRPVQSQGQGWGGHEETGLLCPCPALAASSPRRPTYPYLFITPLAQLYVMLLWSQLPARPEYPCIPQGQSTITPVLCPCGRDAQVQAGQVCASQNFCSSKAVAQLRKAQLYWCGPTGLARRAGNHNTCAGRQEVLASGSLTCTLSARLQPPGVQISLSMQPSRHPRHLPLQAETAMEASPEQRKCLGGSSQPGAAGGLPQPKPFR